ncbi:MAG: SpoIIE family protein phosphatase [Planctomycetota bacterium]
MSISRRLTKTFNKAAKTSPVNSQASCDSPQHNDFTHTSEPQAALTTSEPLLDEPVIEELQEVEADQVSLTTEPQPQSLARHATPHSNLNPRKTSGVHLQVRAHSHSHLSSVTGHKGVEIGNLQRRGWSMVAKFSVFTLLMILLIISLFGWFSIKALENSVTDEILRSGHQQVLSLHSFGQRIMLNAKVEALQQDADNLRSDPAAKAIIIKIADWVKNGGNPADLLKNYADLQSQDYIITADEIKRLEQNGDDYRKLLENYRHNHRNELASLERIVKGDSRVKDVVFFSSFSSATPILRYDISSREFASPAQSDSYIELPGQDKDINIYWGSYDKERCLYFHLPLEKKSAAARLATASVNLILSANAIDEKKSAMINQLLLLGIIFIAIGLVLSRFLALLIARPINALVNDINIVAKGTLEHESMVPNQTQDEIGLLAMAFNRMTRNLRDARDKEREAQRLSSEVNSAKAIHQKLLPEKLPNLPNLDIAVAYHCAKEVGGDYYDFIPVGDDEHLGFCVADVSGKGIPGSMVMGTTRTYLRMMAVNNYSAADVLARTNAWVVRDIKRGMFVTCVYAIMNLRTREMTIASAGHNPILIWRAAENKIEKVRINGIALGFDKGPIFNRTIREEKIKLNIGDRVVLYTDGVTESMNEKREEWTEEQLERFTLQHAQQSSQEYVRLLIKALMEHQGKAEQHDDITVVTFKIKAP